MRSDARAIRVVDCVAQYVGDGTPAWPHDGRRMMGRILAVVQKESRFSSRASSIVEIENGRIKRFTDYWDLASFFRRAPSDSAVR